MTPASKKARKTKRDGYRLQAYLKPHQEELIRKAVELLDEKSLSGFATRVALAEAKRVIAEHQAARANNPGALARK